MRQRLLPTEPRDAVGNAYIWGANGDAGAGGRLWIVCPNGCCARGEYEDLMAGLPKWWRYATPTEVAQNGERVRNAVLLRQSLVDGGEFTGDVSADEVRQ